MTVIGEGDRIECLRGHPSTAWAPFGQSIATWVDQYENFAAPTISLQFIQNVWSLARWRYVAADAPTELYVPRPV